jgi:hypothetical protein
LFYDRYSVQNKVYSILKISIILNLLLKRTFFRFEGLFLFIFLKIKMFDVFISYDSGIQKQVKQLYDILKSLNYQVWLDERELNAGSNSLTADLALAIRDSKVILSCITKDYCRSFNCNLEIEYATAKKKQMITLLVEEIDTTKIDEIQVTGRGQASGIGFIIT